MKRVQNYVPLMEVTSADLNDIQDAAAGLLPASKHQQLATLGTGAQGVEWMYDNDLATGTLIQVDGTIDWRDRLVTVAYTQPGGGSEEPGGGNDYLLDFVPTWRKGYTGLGARDAGGVSAPTNGNPPVPASTVSWALQVTTDLWLYVDPVGFGLYLYNNTGSTIRKPMLTVTATAKTGAR